MKKRKLVSLKCPKCLRIRTVRADGCGEYCRSCRASMNSFKKIGKIEDLTGKTYGQLIVLSYATNHTKKYHWNCKCTCGNKVIIQRTRLITGKTRSCGCLTKTQKGLSQSAEYRSWDAMIQRCYDSKVAHYQRYGAKGIQVCERWHHSFLNFLEDMGQRPIGYSLDRIDSTKGYSKENCRWATALQQANNQTSNHLITAFNKTQTLTQWANEYSIGWSTLLKRINLGWPIEKALTKKVNHGCKKENSSAK